VFKAITFLSSSFVRVPPFLWWLCVPFLVHGIFLGFVVKRVGCFILVSRCAILVGGVHLCQGQYGFCMAMETSSFVLCCCFLGVQVHD
jgi:hypothetical protein